MILNIVKYGDDNSNKLRIKNIDVKKENPFLNQLIDNMFDTLDFYNMGVGLSAPQVGHNLNLFIIKSSNFKEVFINPEIRLEGLGIQVKENCLSFRDMTFATTRKENVKIKFFDRNWVYRISEFSGVLAISVQHEYDHLKGKLIID